VSNIVDGRISFKSSKFISAATHSELTRRCPIEVGDVLYTIVGSYGNAAVVEHDRPFSFQRHIAHLKPERTRVLPRYLARVLGSEVVRAQVDRVVRGVAQKTLNLSELKTLQIPVPPITEQRRIAGILDKADELRAERRAALEQLNTLTRSVFLEMFGALLTNVSEHAVPLRDCAEVVSGVTKGRRFNGRATVDVPYLRVANVQGGFLDLSEVKTIPALPDEVEALRLMPGDVVLTEGGISTSWGVVPFGLARLRTASTRTMCSACGSISRSFLSTSMSTFRPFLKASGLY
jgi:type I restriction enzyme S subunit